MAVSFEAIAINKLLHNEVELVPELAKEYFSGKHQKIYQLILEYYSENSKLPTAETIKATINVKAPVTVRGGFVALVDALLTTDLSIENEIITKSLQEAHILRGVDGKIEELVEAQRGKDAQKVKGILSTLLEDIAIQNVKIDDFTDAIEQDDHFAVVPSGLGEEFDDLIGGGMSGLALITAKSGGGKSIWLQQAAVESFKAGKNVLYLSLELSGKVLGNRVKSYLSGVNFGTINTGKCSKEEQECIDKVMTKTFKDKKNVWRVTTTPIDATELLNIIKVEKQLHDIDVVVIDYLGLVSPAKNDRGESWASIASTAKALHKLTMKENLTIITASQITEVSKAKDGVEPTITTRGSRELEFSATQFFYVDKVESEDPDITPLTIFQIKNRLAKKVHSMVNGEFSTMKFVDSGTRLN